VTDRKRIVRTGYNTIVDAYLATRRADSDDVRLLEKIIHRLPKNARVLDAGCGAGVPVTQKLSEHFEVVGADFSEAQVQRARELVPKADFVCQDMTNLTFSDESFDGIVSYYAIIHIPREEHEGIFRQFHRLLKPCGLALLCLGAGDLENDIVEDYLGARMYWSHFGVDTNVALLTTSGFEIISTQLVDDSTSPDSSHLFVLVEKK
jgi:SAM-dependent methyltransferase